VTGLRLANTPPSPRPTDSADAVLAQSLILGDPAAARAAWFRFAPLVHRILQRTFGAGNGVEDVQQEVFVAFFRKVPGLRDPNALRAFILSITAKSIQYELRRRRVQRFLWSRHEPVKPEDSTDPPDVAARQALRTFYGILERLNSFDRTTFSLRFLEGLDLQEVASSLGISVSSTKRHLGRIWRLVAARVRGSPALAPYLLPEIPE
jgi:RNA polymerase sigma-70 factor (ECF subfamily)